VRRTLVLAAVGCLLLPAAAAAKGGVIFDKYPDVQALGAPMKFTVMLMDGRGTPGKPMGAIEGVRPLISFRNPATGEVVRVRASRSDLNGIVYGTVRLRSHGPWDTEVTVNGKAVLPGDSEPFRVGVGLTQTIPAADANPSKPTPSDSGGFPWVWVLSFGAIGSALLVLAMRRRGHWGAA
jgi:hypothetical protein